MCAASAQVSCSLKQMQYRFAVNYGRLSIWLSPSYTTISVSVSFILSLHDGEIDTTCSCIYSVDREIYKVSFPLKYSFSPSLSLSFTIYVYELLIHHSTYTDIETGTGIYALYSFDVHLSLSLSYRYFPRISFQLRIYF